MKRQKQIKEIIKNMYKNLEKKIIYKLNVFNYFLNESPQQHKERGTG